jgi:hypothetical protein
MQLNRNSIAKLFDPMNELVRKDFFVALGIWLALELICFAILPLLNLTEPWPKLQPWFLLSLFFGIGGAIFTASSTQVNQFLKTQDFFLSKPKLRAFLVSLVAWLGLLGIGFPLFVISLQIFGKLFGFLKT